VADGRSGRTVDPISSTSRVGDADREKALMPSIHRAVGRTRQSAARDNEQTDLKRAVAASWTSFRSCGTIV